MSAFGTTDPFDVRLRPLLTVFMLTAVATAVALLSRTANELLAVALLLDFVPVVGVVVATAVAIARLKRVPCPLIRLVLPVYSYFAGALVGTLAVAHVVAVVIRSIDRARQQQFVYDFHVYSLVLLGVLLIAGGLMVTIETAGLARRHRPAWRTSMSVWTAILAINLPLVPIQSLAIVFSVVAALALLLLGGTRRQFGQESIVEHDDPAG